MNTGKRIQASLATVARDIADGLFQITHNGFALLGLAVMFGGIMLTAQPDMRQAGELQNLRNEKKKQTRDANAAKMSAHSTRNEFVRG